MKSHCILKIFTNNWKFSFNRVEISLKIIFSWIRNVRHYLLRFESTCNNTSYPKFQSLVLKVRTNMISD